MSCHGHHLHSCIPNESTITSYRYFLNHESHYIEFVEYSTSSHASSVVSKLPNQLNDDE